MYHYNYTIFPRSCLNVVQWWMSILGINPSKSALYERLKARNFSEWRGQKVIGKGEPSTFPYVTPVKHGDFCMGSRHTRIGKSDINLHKWTAVNEWRDA